MVGLQVVIVSLDPVLPLTRKLELAPPVPSPIRRACVLMALLSLACSTPDAKAGLGPESPSEIVRLVVSPSSATVDTDGVLQYTVAAVHADSEVSAPAVIWTAGGGTISSAGRYEPADTPGTYSVTATLLDGSISGAATVTVAVPQSPIARITVSPDSVGLFAGGSRQFLVTATRVDGSTFVPAVNWTATGGTISGNGLYTAGGTSGSYRVIATQQGGALKDTSAITISPPAPNAMYFNSSEPGGDGSNPNYLLADDFEDGDWYTKDCDEAESSGGLLQTDGWCGTIWANPITPAGAISPPGKGFHGSTYAANGGFHSGGEGARNMATHAFVAPGQDEAYFRVYFQPQSDYDGGHEKMFDFVIEPGASAIVSLCNNYFGSETIRCIPYLHQDDGVQGQVNGWMGSNVAPAVTIIPGHWYYFEYHIRLNTPGQYDGLSEFWMDDLGPNGLGGPATPTLRSRYTNVKYRDAGAEATYVTINGIWIENWANPGSVGTMYYDNVIASRTFIGFMQ